MSLHTFELFADYFQFYLQDEQAEGKLSDAWTDEADGRLLALAPGTLGIGTVRNMDVPVIVEIREDEPMEPMDAWDQIVESSIDVPSGRIVVSGCTDCFPDAPRITVKPGLYRARIFYGGLATVSSDGLDGADRYKVVLWPSSSITTVMVKQWKQAGA